MASTGPPSSPTRRKPGVERRAQIADAALRIIGRQGARALTAATLAEEVGVTPGALYRHFGSLDEILTVAVDRAVQAVEATFPPADLPARERLCRLTTARVALIRRTPGLAWLLLSDQVYLSVPAPAVEQLRALVGRSRAFLRTAVLEAQAEGSLRPEVDPGVVLTLLSGTVHALAGARGVHAQTNDSSDAERVLASLFDLLSPTSIGNQP